MIETLPVTPLSSALGEVLVEVRLLASSWPVEVERRTFEHGLFEAHRDVARALALIGDARPPAPRRYAKPTAIDEAASTAAHDAFMSSLVVALMIQRFMRRAERRRTSVPPSDRAAEAAARLLDALDPWVQRADVALRRVMLDGEPMEQVASSIAPPA